MDTGYVMTADGFFFICASFVGICYVLWFYRFQFFLFLCTFYSSGLLMQLNSYFLSFLPFERTLCVSFRLSLRYLSYLCADFLIFQKTYRQILLKFFTDSNLALVVWGNDVININSWNQHFIRQTGQAQIVRSFSV